MKDIFVEQFFVLINPVWDSSLVYTMTEFGQIHYLKISPNKNDLRVLTSEMLGESFHFVDQIKNAAR